MSDILLSPTTIVLPDGNSIEVSVHSTSRFFRNETQHIFQGIDLSELIAIPTMQRARYDLVNVGDEIEAEKDRLLETFFAFAKRVCEKITMDTGHWADYIDPCSGLPMITPDCNKVYSEVDGAQTLLQYSVMNAGCCKILLHPEYGSSVYPASLFTTAPADVVLEIITDMKT